MDCFVVARVVLQQQLEHLGRYLFYYLVHHRQAVAPVPIDVQSSLFKNNVICKAIIINYDLKKKILTYPQQDDFGFHFDVVYHPPGM